MTNNLEIARIFNQTADILEIKSENPFRIRAYRRAAQNIESLPEDVADIARRKELPSIPGVGADLEAKIEEFLETGKMGYFEKLKKEVPRAYLDFISIPGVGPKTAKILIEKLDVKNMGDLESKAKAHKLSVIPGIRGKTEENILKGIQIIKEGRERVPLGRALPVAEDIIGYLKKIPQTRQIAVCGSLRRQKEAVRDIDILATSLDPRKVMDKFGAAPFIKNVLARGPTKSSVIINEGMQVDVRIVDPKSFGAALLYFTGSKEHNIRVRELAVKKGLKVNEYGVFDVKTSKRMGGETEEEIYRILGLTYIPPELREDRGEIEASLKNKLPRLVEIKDIKGDFHAHTKASDGSNSIEELAEAAIKKGYQYIVISDHSKTLPIAGGLKDKEMLSQVRTIRKMNKRYGDFRIFAGAEVDILEDGSLGYGDKVLSELDMVVAAVHTGFKQSKEKLTGRITRAMRNKHVNIIAHLTSRLMGSRDPYPLDMEEIFKVARDTNTALEINAYPLRLDIDDINARRAGQMGVMIALATDTHSIDQLDNMRYGVSVARRAWLKKEDVINTLSAEAVVAKLKKY